MVWSTTASNSPDSVSRSTWSRSRTPNASMDGLGGVVAAPVEAAIHGVAELGAVAAG
jgi:hypothetical protein